MHQINLEPLLKIGSSASSEQPLRIDPTKLYPATLQTDSQGSRLSVQTGTAQLQIQLSAAQTAQILQSTPVSVETGGTRQGTAINAQPPFVLLQSSAQKGANLTSGSAQQLALQVQFKPLGSSQVEVSVQTKLTPIQVHLSADDVLALLVKPAPAAGQTISPFAFALQNKHPELQLAVTLKAQTNGVSIQLADGQQALISDKALLAALKAQHVETSAAHLVVGRDGITLMLSSTKSAVTTDGLSASRHQSLPPGATIGASAPRDNPKEALTAGPRTTLEQQSNDNSRMALSTSTQKTLLPLLAQQVWPHKLQTQLSEWLPSKLADQVPKNSQYVQWQLTSTPTDFELKLQPTASLKNIRLPSTELPAALQFPMQKLTTATIPDQSVKDLWRQLLPLQIKPDLLQPSADLPLPVRQVLQLLAQQHPQLPQAQDPIQLQQQLNATLQFQPLQLTSNNSTAATFALAIQLLLGRLGATLPQDKQPSPLKEKMAQLIGQLDKTQSANLLKQLSGHSSQFQAGQLANLEQQGQKPGEQQLFIQLPLLYQGESHFAEIAVGEREAENAEKNKVKSAWQLSMKFQLAVGGDLLVKIRLHGNQVEMTLYSNHEQTVQTAERFLPLLKDRLKEQGVLVESAECHLGKIPEHLYQQGNSLLQVRV